MTNKQRALNQIISASATITRNKQLLQLYNKLDWYSKNKLTPSEYNIWVSEKSKIIQKIEALKELIKNRSKVLLQGKRFCEPYINAKGRLVVKSSSLSSTPFDHISDKDFNNGYIELTEIRKNRIGIHLNPVITQWKLCLRTGNLILTNTG